MSPRQRRGQRPGIQLMFQDAFASLDPRMRVRSILREPLVIQKTVRRRGHRRQVARILDEVGLPADAADRYPREFSGGQRQRLALARALIQRPALIVADEPVSALDVSVQAQILNLMRKLQRQYGLSYLFISHDLSVIRYMADTIGVMYLGKLVEIGPAEDICTAPAHPYTAGLIEAVPVVTGEPSPGQRGRPAATGPDRSAAHRPTSRRHGRRRSRHRAAGSAPGARSPRTSAPSRSRRCGRICRQVSWSPAISRVSPGAPDRPSGQQIREHRITVDCATAAAAPERRCGAAIAGVLPGQLPCGGSGCNAVRCGRGNGVIVGQLLLPPFLHPLLPVAFLCPQ